MKLWRPFAYRREGGWTFDIRVLIQGLSRIILLIWGSFIPSIYYGFAEDMEWVRVYWSMVSFRFCGYRFLGFASCMFVRLDPKAHLCRPTGNHTGRRRRAIGDVVFGSKTRRQADDYNVTQITTIGAATMVVVLFPRFRTPAWRPFRAFMFVAMGLSALFPVIHGVKAFGVAQLERQIGLSWLVTQGVLYILGAGIYAVSTYTPLRCDFVCKAREAFQQRHRKANRNCSCRLASRKSWRRARSTSGAVRTRYSMCLW